MRFNANVGTDVVAASWAFIPALYLLAFWADVDPRLRVAASIALLASVVVVSSVSYWFLVSSQRNVRRPGEKRPLKRSSLVVAAYLSGALLCYVLPHKPLERSLLTKFEGRFRKFVIEDSHYRIVFTGTDGEDVRFRIDHELAEAAGKTLIPGAYTTVYLDEAYVCRLEVDGTELVSVDDYERIQRGLGRDVAGCLLVFAVLYVLFSTSKRKERENVAREEVDRQ